MVEINQLRVELKFCLVHGALTGVLKGRRVCLEARFKVVTMEEFFAAFNTYAMTHPEILKVMHTLFWVKWWILLGMIFWFCYKMQQPVMIKKREARQARKRRFIA